MNVIKLLLSIFLFGVASNICYSQDIEKIYDIVEEPAQPIGGMNTFYKWIGKNLKYPKEAIRMGVEGKVYIEFIVEKDGALKLKKITPDFFQNSLEKLFKTAKKWKPAKHQGQLVRQRVVLPLHINLG